MRAAGRLISNRIQERIALLSWFIFYKIRRIKPANSNSGLQTSKNDVGFDKRNAINFVTGGLPGLPVIYPCISFRSFKIKNLSAIQTQSPAGEKMLFGIAALNY
jgi:hypothetical protein